MANAAHGRFCELLTNSAAQQHVLRGDADALTGPAINIDQYPRWDKVDSAESAVLGFGVLSTREMRGRATWSAALLAYETPRGVRWLVDREVGWRPTASSARRRRK